jgi:hypothetical protein
MYIMPLLLVYVNLVNAIPVKIELHGLQVIETKTNGSAWDAGFGTMLLPDLVVSIYQGERLIWATNKVSNRFEISRILTSPTLQLDHTLPVRIEVIDKDLQADDLIERFTLKLEDLSSKQFQKLSLTGKSVIKLNLLIKHTPSQTP